MDAFNVQKYFTNQPKIIFYWSVGARVFIIWDDVDVFTLKVNITSWGDVFKYERKIIEIMATCLRWTLLKISCLPVSWLFVSCFLQKQPFISRLDIICVYFFYFFPVLHVWWDERDNSYLKLFTFSKETTRKSIFLTWFLNSGWCLLHKSLSDSIRMCP